MQDFTHFLQLHAPLAIAAFAVITLLFIVEFLRAKANHFSIDTAKAVQLINRENAVVIDIRLPESYQAGHITDAHSFKSDEVTASNKKIEKFKNKPIIIVCETGVSSQKVAANLIAAGFKAHSLSGGMRAWVDAGIPTVKG